MSSWRKPTDHENGLGDSSVAVGPHTLPASAANGGDTPTHEGSLLRGFERGNAAMDEAALGFTGRRFCVQ